jgi:uncharacterized protein
LIIVDTGGLIAAIDRGDRHHRATARVLDEARKSSIRLLISPFVLTEVDYLISERKKRPDVALAILRDVARGAYKLEEFSAEDLGKAADIVDRYRDQAVGLADAANVVLADRHGTRDILTTDERHFRVLRGPQGLPFRVLPADL